MWKRLSVIWLALRGDARKLWFALGHPDTPGWFKAGAAGLALYLLSPVDLIPDVLPVIGVVDDLVIVPLAMRWLLERLPAHIRAHAANRAKEPAFAKARSGDGRRQSPWNPSRR
ncbi:MAG: DUF1232 domain-containing protein [Hydrogenophaga sp.]|nr:DUF1232 domain-containing protein [Hydrogenophaga sp.]